MTDESPEVKAAKQACLDTLFSREPVRIDGKLALLLVDALQIHNDIMRTPFCTPESDAIGKRYVQLVNQMNRRRGWRSRCVSYPTLTYGGSTDG